MSIQRMEKAESIIDALIKNANTDDVGSWLPDVHVSQPDIAPDIDSLYESMLELKFMSTSDDVTTPVSSLSELQRVFGVLYQILGCHDASEMVLDLVSDLCSGDDITLRGLGDRFEYLLPYAAPQAMDAEDWAELHRLRAQVSNSDGESWQSIAAKERLANRQLKNLIQEQADRIQLLENERRTADYDSEKRCREYYHSYLKPYHARSMSFDTWRAVWMAAQYDKASMPELRQTEPRIHDSEVLGQPVIDWEELSNEGLTDRINMEILHPRGLTLSFNKDRNVSVGALESPEGYWDVDTNNIRTASIQRRAGEWARLCFGPTIARDPVIRNHRFMEEAVELVQSLGCTRNEVLNIVDYVYGRDAGDPKQEVGGVAITLATLCAAHGMNVTRLAELEMRRIESPEVRAAIGKKSSNKPSFTDARPDRNDAWRNIAIVADDRVRKLSAIVEQMCDDHGVDPVDLKEVLYSDVDVKQLIDQLKRDQL